MDEAKVRFLPPTCSSFANHWCNVGQVGYGDIFPSTPQGRVVMAILIVVMLVQVPVQINLVMLPRNTSTTCSSSTHRNLNPLAIPTVIPCTCGPHCGCALTAFLFAPPPSPCDQVMAYFEQGSMHKFCVVWIVALRFPVCLEKILITACTICSSDGGICACIRHTAGRSFVVSSGHGATDAWAWGLNSRGLPNQ